MNSIVVFESVYGNTRAVAEAVADGLGRVPVVPVHEAARHTGGLDLIVVGGPTHVHGLASSRTRHAGVEAAQKEGASDVDPDATEEPGVRSWLGDLAPGAACYAAAFDTRLDRSPLLTGAASRGIARRLRHHGFDVIDTESFLVEGSEGPLEAGELERARAWGAKLAESVPAVAETAGG